MSRRQQKPFHDLDGISALAAGIAAGDAALACSLVSEGVGFVACMELIESGMRFLRHRALLAYGGCAVACEVDVRRCQNCVR